jgi:hypothetical protein
MIRTALEYIHKLRIDSDDLEDVEEELSSCIEAWNTSNISNNVINLNQSNDDPILERLFKKIKMYDLYKIIFNSHSF